MVKVELETPLKVNGKEVKVLNLDLSKLNGHAILNAERECRLKGDPTPDLNFSMQYLLTLAATAADVNPEDLFDLSGPDIVGLIAEMKAFLLGKALPQNRVRK